jgi:3',5'-cyclic AMP phosphodiesterase CpdA
MRVLHLSDSHLRGDGKLSFRVVDTKHWLEVAAAHFKSLTQKADCVVITGDLADCGDAGAYKILREAFDQLGTPVYAVPGNHDRRDRMLDLLPDWCPADPAAAPHICYTVDMGPARLVMVDTMQPGSHSGHFMPLVAEWLTRILAEKPDAPTLLFMHHPPFLTGMGAMDEPFENLDAFATLVRQYPNLRLCCGHMHRPITTVWQGLVAVSAPSLSMQIELDISETGGDAFRMETPGYLLHHWLRNAWNTHVCQIPSEPTFAGPFPFADSINPTE